MISIVGISVACQFSKNFFVLGFYCRFRFQNNICCTFSKGKSGAVFIKGTAAVFIQDHQGIKPVEGEFCHRISTAGNGPVDEACLDQLCPEHDRICRRGTGSADGGHKAGDPKKIGNPLGAVAAIVVDYID